MSWEAIGAIGEVVGGIGVIVTLAYLARQMQVNTAALRNETTRDGMQAVIDSYSTVIADEEVASIYLRGLENFNALSEVEQIRFHYVCCQRLHAAQMNVTFNQRSGQSAFPLDVTVKPWIDRMMQRQGFRQWWQSRGRVVYSPEFIRFVESKENAIEEVP